MTALEFQLIAIRRTLARLDLDPDTREVAEGTEVEIIWHLERAGIIVQPAAPRPQSSRTYRVARGG